MVRHCLLGCWTLLLMLLPAACSPIPAATQPGATAPAPAVTPSVSATATATAPPGSATPAPTWTPPPLDPTLQAYCQQPGYDTMPECEALQVALPPAPAEPLAAALRQFNDHALLYVQRPAFLMIGDADTGASLWINGSACPPRSTRDVYGEWSPDGQYIAFVCQDNRNQAAMYLLDMQAGSVSQIAAGLAAAFAWAPQGHQLLVAEQSSASAQRGVLLDAQTGATTALPTAPWWKNEYSTTSSFGPAALFGSWYIDANPAGMAWSPDGSRIAVVADQIYVFDADVTHAHDGVLATAATIAGSSMHVPYWSHDGRHLYLVVPQQNHTDPLAPSSMAGSREVRAEVSTGEISDSYPAEGRWSPDARFYLSSEANSEAWTIYQADGTPLRTVAGAALWGPFWLPDSQHILLVTSQYQSHEPNTQLTLTDLAGQARVLIDTTSNIGFWRLHRSVASADGSLLAIIAEPMLGRTSQHVGVIIYDLDGQQRAMFDGGAVMGWRGA